MKKLLLVLLALPLIGFGQQCISGNCKNGQGPPNYDFGQCISGNCKNGQGTRKWANGEKYVGEWRDSWRSGQGTFTCPNGHKYVGEWMDDKQHGQGTYTWANGDKYVGEWMDNKQHGQGTYTWANGDKYVGTFKDGDKHGQGTFTYANGDKYVGEWVTNSKKGQGTNYWKQASEYHNMPAGSQYEGQWLYGKKHGFGKSTYADGTVKQGLWENGVPNSVEEQIYIFVEKKINQWELKGEFEKISDYGLRVNDKTRAVKITEFQEEAINTLKSNFLKSIDFSNIELGAYDPENETFLLKAKDSKVGNLVLFVPINEAPNFKENFSKYKYLNPQSEFIDAKFVLSHVDVVFGKKTYSYNIPNNICTSGDCENGYGVFTSSEGTYKGNWKNGKVHGTGVFVGILYTYDGQYVNGQQHGQGKKTFTSGKIEEGTFENGNFLGK